MSRTRKRLPEPSPEGPEGMTESAASALPEGPEEVKRRLSRAPEACGPLGLGSSREGNREPEAYRVSGPGMKYKSEPEAYGPTRPGSSTQINRKPKAYGLSGPGSSRERDLEPEAY